MKRISTKTKLIMASAAAVIIAIPVVGQDAPESLLPPGFGDPPPAPPPPPPSSGPQPSSSTQPSRPSQSGSSVGSAPKAAASSSDEDEEEGDEEEEDRIVFDVPPAGERSLKQIGVISAANGGFAVNAFGDADGAFLNRAAKLTKGPLVSRWATIMTRRMLVSRINTPDGLNGADWAAERAWLLLRMGDAVAARQLVQQVDAGNYSERLYEVSMQVFLATADLGAMCPLAPNAYKKVKDASWKMARPICASLAGEQGTATAQLNQARGGRWASGVDYLLAEKAVGAGTNGRRSVKIEWDKVKDFNAWRFGLSYATGVEPPKPLLASSGRHVDGWRARLPMIDINNRMNAAPTAASLGAISNRAFTGIYAIAADDPDANEANKALADQLAAAYIGNSDSGKVTAMAALWDGANEQRSLYSMFVLTARAAALIAPSQDYGANGDRLVASMMTAGLDTNAATWAGQLDSGSLGWGILAVGAPGMDGQVSYGQLDDFYDNDQSANVLKSKFLLASLAGLGRVDSAAQTEFAEDIELDLTRASKWSRAIDLAAQRGQSGTVVLLSALALQGSSWQKVAPVDLFHIIRALKQVGLDAEARMIAAEAVTLG
ncbi:hypothetical protein ACFOWX_04730 [Sphingorhabdus arenilitoris]|uniref:Uncharacterized protein n=1 Tax=Sphingorhabdus arenilitoris TaxID=1490041 RepID=A0ABV8REC2_9SPHN